MRHLLRASWILSSIVSVNAGVEVPLLIPRTCDSAVFLDIRVECPSIGASIYYTINGEDPTIHDRPVVNGATIRISRTAVLKAKAWLDGETSPVATDDYRITGAVVSAYQHGMALSKSGHVWTWGTQDEGRLGNGETAVGDLLSPIQVLHGGGNFEDGSTLAGGYNHSVVIDQSFNVWAFGDNSNGQLGDGTDIDSAVPLRVLKSEVPEDYMGPCVEVDAAENFSVALSETGIPYAWGSQETARLGNGVNSSTPRPYAVPVKRGDEPSYPELSGIRSVATGNSHGLAREPNSQEVAGGRGRVWVWGHNHAGQLGLGNTSSTPRAVLMLLDATTVLTDAFDADGGGNFSMVVRWNLTDPNLHGTVWATGSGANGRLGNGNTSSDSISYPTKVLKGVEQPLEGIEQVSAGSCHTLALDRDGHVWAWGNNQYGQLGIGTTSHGGYAQMVKDEAGTGVLGNIVMVSAGGDGTEGTSLALAADGTIWAWGRNTRGQLGNGETSSTRTLPSVHAQNHVEDGAPSILLTHEIENSTAPFDVTLTAQPSHSGPNGLTHVVNVEFFVNGLSVGSVGSSPWTVDLEDLSPGPRKAYAIITDDRGVVAMSPSVSFDPVDRDGDGIPSSWEIANGFDPADQSDGAADPDQDQLNNFQEMQNSTNPHDKDTDDDYVPDGIEVFGIQ